GWGQPPNQSGWGQPNQPSPPGQEPPRPGQQPPPWQPAPGPGGYGGGTKHCPSCGSVIDARAADCPRCGVRQPDNVYREPKNRPIAILLALFLGSFGIHRFYVGPIAWGIVYLIFFWTGIPGFLAWLEAIYWLTRSDEEWAYKYGGPVTHSNGLAIGCLWALALWPLIVLVLLALSIGGLVFVGGEIGSILSEISVELEPAG
ncbi:MAG: NINE protein, partial [Candidatus Limnocylindrales bacterium]